MEFKFLTKSNIVRGSFISIPKELYRFSKYRDGLSNDAIILYGLLKDRMNMSIVNGLKDDDGRYFVIATLESIMNALRLSRNTARKTLKELENMDLVLVIPMQGFNAGRRIYLGDIDISEENFAQNVVSKNDPTGVKFWRDKGSKFGRGGGQKLDPNNTNINNTFLNNKKNSIKCAYMKEFDFENDD